MIRDQLLSGPVGAAAFAIPFMLLLTYNGMADQTAVILALLALTALLAFSDIAHRMQQRASFMVLGGMLCWGLLSSQWSAFPHLSLQSCAFLLLWFLGFLALPALRSEGSAEKLLLVLSFPVAAFALYLAYRFMTTGQRTGGLFVDRNTAAALLNGFFFPCLFVSMAARAQGRRGTAAALAAALIVTFAGIAFTFSLAGIATWLAGIALSLVVVGVRARGSMIHLAFVAVVCGCLYFAITSFVTAYIPEGARHTASIYTPAERVFGQVKNTSWKTRVLLYRTTWSIYRDHPVIGTGVGTFAMEYAGKRDPREWGTSGAYAHSDPLQLLMEGGPILLLLSLAPALIALLRLIRFMRPGSLAGAGFAVGLLVLYLQSMVNFVFYSPAIALMAGMYLAGASDLLAPATTLAPARVPVLPQQAKAVVIAFLAAFVGFIAVDTYSLVTTIPRYCDSLWCEGRAPSPADRLQTAKATSSLQPGNLNARLYVVGAYADAAATQPDPSARLGIAGRAMQEAGRLLDKFPEMPSALVGMADLLQRFPELRGTAAQEYSDPEALYLRALERNQTFMPAYQGLYQLYASRGDYQAGFKLLTERAMQWYSPATMSSETAESILSSAMDAAGRLGLHEDQYLLAIEVLRVAPQNAVALAYMEKHKGYDP